MRVIHGQLYSNPECLKFRRDLLLVPGVVPAAAAAPSAAAAAPSAEVSRGRRAAVRKHGWRGRPPPPPPPSPGWRAARELCLEFTSLSLLRLHQSQITCVILRCFAASGSKQQHLSSVSSATGSEIRSLPLTLPYTPSNNHSFTKNICTNTSASLIFPRDV